MNTTMDCFNTGCQIYCCFVIVGIVYALMHLYIYDANNKKSDNKILTK